MQIVASAPVRTADLGGWTDTWFASSGRVCNVAVEPGIGIDLEFEPDRRLHGEGPTVTVAVGAGVCDYVVAPGVRPVGVDPLVAAVVTLVPPPWDTSIRITSGVPAGSGLGTSAALAVALLAGLHSLHGRSPSPASLATDAHSAETSLGLQSGIQDQLASAFGGAHLFEIAYPTLRARPQRLAEPVAALLDASLVTVYLGRPHRSSEIHDQVIASLESTDNERLLAPLRSAATEGFAALCAADLDAYGLALQANHIAQKALHPSLVSELAEQIVTTAKRHGARGWKVNGAGGEGGSMCLLAPTDPEMRAHMIAAVEAIGHAVVLPIRCAREGVTVVNRP